MLNSLLQNDRFASQPERDINQNERDIKVILRTFQEHPMYEIAVQKRSRKPKFSNPDDEPSMSESQQLVAAEAPAAPQSCAWKESRLCAGILIITGLLLILAGIATRNTVATTLDTSLNAALVVDSPASPGFKAWQSNSDPTTPPSFKSFWVYNMTNYDRYEAGLEKLRVEEIGPFVYRSYFEHLNVTWADGQMSYKTWQYYVFESGPISINSTIVSVNIPYQLVLPSIKDYGNAAFLPYNIITGNPKSLFVSMTIHEALWGYQSTILQKVKNSNPYVSSFYSGLSAGNMSDVEAVVNSTAYDTVWTGQKAGTNAQEWVKFQNNETLSLCFTPPCPPKPFTAPWATAEANTIRGYTGRQYGRNVKPSDKLPWFNLYMLRLVNLVYDSAVTLFGVDLYRFIIEPSAFQNVTENPANADFFSFGVTGIVNLTAAVARTPFLMTKPHFLDADSSLFDYVDGVPPPKRDLHDSFFDVEPETGAVLNGKMRLQANFLIGTVVLPDAAKHTFFPNASTIVCPLYWFEDGGGLDEDFAWLFASTVYMAHRVALASVWIGSVVGVAVVFSGCFIAKRIRDARSAVGLSYFGAEELDGNRQYDVLPAATPSYGTPTAAADSSSFYQASFSPSHHNDDQPVKRPASFAL